MALNLISIGSSSSGNSYLIQSDSTNIILDVGLSAKRIKAGIEFAYLRPDNIDAILVTHEHTDHVGSIRAISKACENAFIYASRGTVNMCDKFQYVEPSRIRYVKATDEFEIGNIRTNVFKLSHDAAEPIGFAFTDGEDTLVVATDTGVLTPDIFQRMATANMLLIEANYEEQLLMVGPYPYQVKRRILSEYGHLSNVNSAEVLVELLKQRALATEVEVEAESEVEGNALRVMLGHISANNNSPLQASMTVISELEQAGFSRGRDYIMTVASKEELVVME